MKDYLDGHSLMHPFSDRSWVINEDPFYVPNGVKIAFSKNTVPDPETKAFLEKFRKDTSRSIPNLKAFLEKFRKDTSRSIPNLKDFAVPLSEIGKRKANTLPKINKVIFNDPATIVLWADGTKTVVKCFEGDVYTKWAGLAFCICKKMMGDNFHKEFRRWCGEDEIRSPIVVSHSDHEEQSESMGIKSPIIDFGKFSNDLRNAIESAIDLRNVIESAIEECL